MTPDLLSQLKDIHYPPAVSFWPPAIGWYILMLMVILLLVIVSYVGIKIWRKHYVKRVVLARLIELENLQNDQNTIIAEELSALLKRAALARYQRRDVAGLHGLAWLAFLDKTAQTTEFSAGPGRLLMRSPYQKRPESIPSELFHLLRTWVKKNL
jgi:hypothetical protein